MSGRLFLENRTEVPVLHDGHLRVTSTGVFHHQDDGTRTQIMPEVTAAVLIESGCSVTSSAVRTIVEGGAQILWLSKTGLKVEAVAPAPTSGTLDLLRRQAALAELGARRAAALRSLTSRFGDTPPGAFSENQFRGWEGARMRALYQSEAERRGFRWTKRVNDSRSDLLNSLISSCNAAVYTSVHAGLLALNMSPHLGWLHVGAHAAVYDFAEHFKYEHSLSKVFDWFVGRDRESPIPSNFQFARESLPGTLLGVFGGLHAVADEVLP